MDQNWFSPPPVAHGTIFERSGARTLGVTALWGMGVLLGACMVSAALNGQAGVGLKGLLIGIGLLVFAPLQALRVVRSWLMRRRLVIGSDCIQVIEGVGVGERVVLQIPYANIADFGYEESARRVGIDLNRLDDTETYAPSEDFQRNRKTGGRHYYITVGYRSGPRAIASEIEQAYSRWDEESPE